MNETTAPPSPEPQDPKCPRCGEPNRPNTRLCSACCAPVQPDKSGIERASKAAAWQAQLTRDYWIAAFGVTTLLSCAWLPQPVGRVASVLSVILLLWRGRPRFRQAWPHWQAGSPQKDAPATPKNNWVVEAPDDGLPLPDEADPIARIVNTVVLYGIKDGAETIRLIAGIRGVIVHYRIGNEWHEQMKIPSYVKEPLFSYITQCSQNAPPEQKGLIQVRRPNQDHLLSVSHEVDDLTEIMYLGIRSAA